jgi:short-subunit dehydrogenase
MTKRALVTGASSGIGLHLARELARNGHDLLLVAPVEAEVQEVADVLGKQFGVRAEGMGVDLTTEDGLRAVTGARGGDGQGIEILVNNAGLGQRARFWEYPLERDLTMLRLNIEAVVRLTKAFLPTFLSRGSGRILNVASIAGFEPGPNLAVYHATKAFVLSFSEALATEVDGSGVTVTTLCPGPTDTDFFEKADMENVKGVQKGSVMAPQEVAEKGYAAMMAGERVLVTGAVNKAMVFARHLMPESAQAKKNEKMYEDVVPESRKHRRGDEELDAERKQASGRARS